MRYAPQARKEYTLPDRTIREVDYIAYLIDECELNEWCAKALPDMLAKLRNGQQMLTDKQRAIVAREVHEHGLLTHIKDGFLKQGYADRTDAQVMNNVGPGVQSTKMAQANDKEDFIDGFNDDIPF